MAACIGCGRELRLLDIGSLFCSTCRTQRRGVKAMERLADSSEGKRPIGSNIAEQLRNWQDSEREAEATRLESIKTDIEIARLEAQKQRIIRKQLEREPALNAVPGYLRLRRLAELEEKRALSQEERNEYERLDTQCNATLATLAETWRTQDLQDEAIEAQEEQQTQVAIRSADPTGYFERYVVQYPASSFGLGVFFPLIALLMAIVCISGRAFLMGMFLTGVGAYSAWFGYQLFVARRALDARRAKLAGEGLEVLRG